MIQKKIQVLGDKLFSTNLTRKGEGLTAFARGEGRRLNGLN
jgi:hypothetical protein